MADDDPFIPAQPAQASVPAAPADVQDSELRPEAVLHRPPRFSAELPNAVADRLTVKETVHFRAIDSGQEAVAEDAYEVKLKSRDVQPFYRRQRVGPEWQPLERGWLDRCSCVHLRNAEGERLQRNPTPEERAAIAARVVEVSLGRHELDTGIEIPPGESARFRPSDLALLEVRCADPAGATLVVNIFPE